MSGLSGLRQVAEALLEARLARLRAAETARRATAAEIAALAAETLRQEAVIAASFETELAGPVLDRWTARALVRRRSLEARLAAESRAADAARAEAQAAFGRAEALRLIDRGALRYPGARGR